VPARRGRRPPAAGAGRLGGFGETRISFAIGAGAVEREFGRLKHEWALLPLRVRGIECVRLHADLTILAQLGCALARARAAALAV
jgi:hypothetical protein